MEENLYIELIYKHLKGEATAEEIVLLNTETAKSNENILLREDIEISWQLADEIDFPSNIDVDADLQKIKQKLEIAPKQTTTNKIVPLWQRLSVAAGLLILVGFGFWAFNQFSGSQTNTFESGNQIKTLALSDGTEVWLNKNSTLSIDNNFGEAIRKVKLNGEAFFDVKRIETAPFIIEANKSTVTVLGTSFNVKEINESTIVSVESGKVRLEGDGQQVELTKGEQGIHDYATNQVVEKTKYSKNNLVWKTGRFIFKSEKLSAVVNQLEHNYDISIKVENPAMFDCEISAVISAKELGAVLEKVAAAGQMKIEVITDKQFILKNGKCE